MFEAGTDLVCAVPWLSSAGTGHTSSIFLNGGGKPAHECRGTVQTGAVSDDLYISTVFLYGM
jgi:hypothetical protein